MFREDLEAQFSNNLVFGKKVFTVSGVVKNGPKIVMWSSRMMVWGVKRIFCVGTQTEGGSSIDFYGVEYGRFYCRGRQSASIG